MVKVKVVKDKVEISGIAEDDLKNIKKLFPANKKHYMYIMEVGFLVSNLEGELNYEEPTDSKHKNDDLYK